VSFANLISTKNTGASALGAAFAIARYASRLATVDVSCWASP